MRLSKAIGKRSIKGRGLLTEEIFVGNGLGKVLLARLEREDGVSKGTTGRGHRRFHVGHARHGSTHLLGAVQTLATDLSRHQDHASSDACAGALCSLRARLQLTRSARSGMDLA
jgi:hypothetical protein